MRRIDAHACVQLPFVYACACVRVLSLSLSVRALIATHRDSKDERRLVACRAEEGRVVALAPDESSDGARLRVAQRRHEADGERGRQRRGRHGLSGRERESDVESDEEDALEHGQQEQQEESADVETNLDDLGPYVRAPSRPM